MDWGQHPQPGTPVSSLLTFWQRRVIADRMLLKHKALHIHTGPKGGRSLPPKPARGAQAVLLAQAETYVACQEGQVLSRWIEEHGGFVHPSLAVVQTTPLCQCRGVLALEAISEKELRQTPLVAVPESLYLTTDQARALLASYDQNKKAPGVSGVLQLALLLAHERNKGQASFWYPYIAALPSQPPSAWLMDEEQLQAALKQVGPLAANWRQAVTSTRAQMAREAALAVQLYGEHLGVTEEEVIWALAQVLSRAFGSGQTLGLAPFIDMCNHQTGCATPDCWEDEELGSVAFISSLKDGRPAPLQAGQELFVSYLSSCTPLAVFLNFGFVPTSQSE